MVYRCQHCKKNVEEVDHAFDQPVNQRLHRKYTLHTASQLKAYIRFLEANIHNVRHHVHFAQLLAFAERKIGSENEYLDWASRGGSYLEAIHHLTVEAHLLKCHRKMSKLSASGSIRKLTIGRPIPFLDSRNAIAADTAV